MKNIYLIPTDKPSRLYIGDNGNFVFGMIQSSIQSRNNDFTNQNIYITSDEEIKKGDWVIDLIDNSIFKSVNNRLSEFGHVDNGGKRYLKIILTTDQDLIKDGIQAIDDDFLEWFVNNSSCEEVVVIYEPKNFFDVKKGWEYKIIIPKEEPKKVLTEEDIWSKEDIDAVTDYINKETLSTKLHKGEVVDESYPKEFKQGGKNGTWIKNFTNK